MKIYHNPRCSKSREGLAILEASKVNFETIHYIETPISKEELIHIIQLLNISPIDLVRKNEKIWKNSTSFYLLSGIRRNNNKIIGRIRRIIFKSGTCISRNINTIICNKLSGYTLIR